MAPAYRENGAVYAVRRNMWDATGVRVGGRMAPLVMPGHRSLEIDTEEDLLLARALASQERALSADLTARLACVRAVGLDFDGVLTDNTVLLNERGEESVRCSRSDGWGIAALRKAGVAVAVFSTEENPVVARRCEKLHIECHQALGDKAAAFRDWVRGLDVSRDETAFVGNDVNDLGLPAGGRHQRCPSGRRRERTRGRRCPSREEGRSRRGARTCRRSARFARRPRPSTMPAPMTAGDVGSVPRACRTEAPVKTPPREDPMPVTIGERQVGEGQPAFLIAEIGINHNGDLELAKRLIDVAARAGCDAVKFQKRTPDLCVPEAQKAWSATPRGAS